MKIPIVKSIIFLAFLLVISVINTLGQAGINISRPQLRLENNKLIIEYNILSGNPDDKFNIGLLVTDSTGAIIKANNLSGDIGDSITPGFDKTIIWNLAADKILINMGIYIEVNAEKLSPPPQAPVEKAEEKMDVEKSKEEKVPVDIKVTKEMPPVTEDNTKEILPVSEDKMTEVKSAETGKNLLLSAVVPGWGLTRLSGGKPWWILAVADAGCVAAAVYYNREASSNYTNYLNSSDATEFDPYFEDASKHFTLSKVFGWSAVGIWIADMCLVGIRTINVKKSTKNSTTSYLKVGSYFDSQTSAACLSINFNF